MSTVGHGGVGTSGRRRFALPGIGPLAFGCLMVAAFCSRYPVVAGLGALAALYLGGLSLVLRGRITRLAWPLTLFLVGLIVSGLLVGAIRPEHLVAPAFWDGDGRALVYYVPLVVFFMIPVSDSDTATIRRMLLAVGVLVLLGFAVHLVLPSSPPSYRGLIAHHISSGAVFGMLATCLVLIGLRGGFRVYTLVGVAMLLPAFAAGSRLVLLTVPVFVALAVFLNLRSKVASVAFVLVSTVAAAVLVPTAASWTLERLRPMLTASALEAVKVAFVQDWGGPGDFDVGGGEHWNLVFRVVTWRYAVGLFGDSPIVGAGFGRFDDIGVEKAGPPLFRFAVGGNPEFSPLHAHNSILHTLAETGIVGLTLILIVWVRLYRTIGKFASDGAASGLVSSSKYILAILFAMSFFTHSFAAPSIGLFAMSVIGVAYSHARWAALRSTDEVVVAPSQHRTGLD